MNLFFFFKVKTWLYKTKLRNNLLYAQTYLQLETTRSEELEEKMKLKERDLELWMSHRLLPENLRKRIRRYEQYKWQKTRGVDEENVICNLPKDLRRDVKRHLCLALLRRVSSSASSWLFLYKIVLLSISFLLKFVWSPIIFLFIPKIWSSFRKILLGVIYILSVLLMFKKKIK